MGGIRQRTIGVVAGLVATAGLVVAGFAAYPLIRYSAFTAQGTSMIPTFGRGSHLRVASVDGDAVHPGDIVLLRPPPKDATLAGEQVVTRVVAVGGRRVSVRDGRLAIDGTLAHEPYVARGARTRDFTARTVPAENVFVLGDNRQDEVGSDFYGPVPFGNLRGRVVDVDAPAPVLLLAIAVVGVLVALAAAFLCWLWLWRQSGRSRSSASAAVSTSRGQRRMDR